MNNNNFEMANADDPEGIIMATQRSMTVAMINVIEEIEKDQSIKTPGLTWSQLKEFIKSFGDKKPTIVVQKGEM